MTVVNSDSGSQWLGNITEFNQYRTLVDWAIRSMESGRLLELPSEQTTFAAPTDSDLID